MSKMGRSPCPNIALPNSPNRPAHLTRTCPRLTLYCKNRETLHLHTNKDRLHPPPQIQHNRIASSPTTVPGQHAPSSSAGNTDVGVATSARHSTHPRGSARATARAWVPHTRAGGQTELTARTDDHCQWKQRTRPGSVRNKMACSSSTKRSPPSKLETDPRGSPTKEEKCAAPFAHLSRRTPSLTLTSTHPATHQPLQATGQHTGTPRRPRVLRRSRHRPSVIVLPSRGHRSRTLDGQRTLEAYLRSTASVTLIRLARTHRTNERTWISKLEPSAIAITAAALCIQP